MQANPVFKPTVAQPPSQPQAPSGYQASVPVTVYRELASELQSTQAKLSFFQLQNEQLTKQNQMLLQEFEAIAQATDRVQAILTQSNLPESKLSEVLASIRASSQINPVSPRPNPQPQSRPPVVKANNATTASPRKVAVQQTTNAIQEAISRARQLATEPAPLAMDREDTLSAETLYYDSSFAAFEAPAPVATPKPKAAPPKLEIREQISSRPLSYEANEDMSESSGLSGWLLTLTIVGIVLTSFGAGYLLMRPFVK